MIYLLHYLLHCSWCSRKLDVWNHTKTTGWRPQISYKIPGSWQMGSSKINRCCCSFSLGMLPILVWRLNQWVSCCGHIIHTRMIWHAMAPPWWCGRKHQRTPWFFCTEYIKHDPFTFNLVFYALLGETFMPIILKIDGLEHQFFLFPIYWEFHHSNWLKLIFFRGVALQHQVFPPRRCWRNRVFRCSFQVQREPGGVPSTERRTFSGVVFAGLLYIGGLGKCISWFQSFKLHFPWNGNSIGDVPQQLRWVWITAVAAFSCRCSRSDGSTMGVSSSSRNLSLQVFWKLAKPKVDWWYDSNPKRQENI